MFGSKKYRGIVSDDNADNECTKAKIQLKKNPSDITNTEKFNYLKFFKNKKQRQDIVMADEKYSLAPNEQSLKGIDNPQQIIKLKDTVETIIRVDNQDERFNAHWKGYCGTCWLCTLDVWFYAGYTNNKNKTNGYVYSTCGQCDHIGGLAASLLAGMFLKTDINPNKGKYNFGVSHGHCNMMKNKFLSMKFDNNRWVLDTAGINNIIERIKTSDLHQSESNLDLKNRLDLVNKAVMERSIKNVTNLWCSEANNMLKAETGARIDVSVKIIKIIGYTTNKLNDKLTAAKNSNPKIKNSRGNSGGGNGDDIQNSEPNPSKKNDNNENSTNPGFDVDSNNDYEAQNLLNENSNNLDIDGDGNNDDDENSNNLDIDGDGNNDDDENSINFGIDVDINNDDEAQNLLDEIRNTEPEIFKNLLTNLINSIDENLEENSIDGNLEENSIDGNLEEKSIDDIGINKLSTLQYSNNNNYPPKVDLQLDLQQHSNTNESVISAGGNKIYRYYIKTKKTKKNKRRKYTKKTKRIKYTKKTKRRRNTRK
ncbi:hypothetical protein N9K75_00110 [bacterium]|nr:hypothetical protein [bacterium]